MPSKRQQELEAQGWTRQSVTDEPRLTELVDTYKELGFEVLLEPFDPDEEDGCTTCMDQDPERYKVIYTRPKSGE
ncbi:MAG: hypothetical protein ABIH04_04045 [Planctomycetota bacterium]